MWLWDKKMRKGRCTVNSKVHKNVKELIVKHRNPGA